MIAYSAEIIGYINFFENITKAKVKDCFLDNQQLVFVVEPGEIGKALGKKGTNIKRVGNLLKKPVKVIEFTQNAVEFLQRVIKPLTASVTIEGDTAIIKSNNQKEKGMLFGREKQNLRKFDDLMKKYFKLGVKIV